MRKKVFWKILTVMLVFAACGDNAGDPFFAVSGITGVPTSGTTGTELILSGTVAPDNATNRTIQWTVQNAGATGASITGGNRLNVTTAGQVTVTATIVNGTARGTNFIDNFVITFRDQFIPVTGITDVPATGIVGTELALTGTAEPYYATNRTIQWTVQDDGATGASITGGNWLNVTAEGDVTVTATIVNGTAIGTSFTEDFVITFSYGHAPFFPVTEITDVPETGTVGTELTLTGTVEPYYASNSAIQWTVQNAGATGAVISNENRLNVTAAGQVTVTATIVNGTAIGTDFTEDFVITFLPSATGIYGDFVWHIGESGITITSYIGSGGNVTIPSYIQGVPVTTIGQFVFSRNQLTGHLTIPDSVTYIRRGAFESNQLTGVTIGSSVQTIGDLAFFNNNQLTGHLIIPDSVTYIGEGAFSGNWDGTAGNQLTGVTIGSSVQTIGNWAFSRNQLTSVIIGNSVEAIGRGAFESNQLTGHLTIPNSVTYIGSSAFAGNTVGIIHQLTSVTIGNNVQTIGCEAFAWNQLSGHLTIPNSVTSIGAEAFDNNQLTSVTIGNSVQTIGSLAFSRNQLTGHLTIPNSVTYIGSSAFAGNTEGIIHQLTSVTIGNNVQTIGNGAFSSNRLTSVTIPNSVTTIESNAFANNQLTIVTIPSNVTLGMVGVFRWGTTGTCWFHYYYSGIGGTFTRQPNTDVWVRE